MLQRKEMFMRAINLFSQSVLAGSMLLASALAGCALTAAASPAVSPDDMAYMKQQQKELEAFKAELKLTPAQEPAWAAFTAAMQPGERSARLGRADMEKLTTPERIDRMRAMRAQQAAEADRRGEATKTFYAALTPEQQKTFDSRGQNMRGKGGQRSDWGHDNGRHGGMRGCDMPMGGPGR